MVVVQVEQNVEASQKSLTDKNMEHAKVRNTASASLPYYLCATLLGHRGGQGGAQRPERRITGDAEMSQQCHKYFFQYSTFPSKRPQTCFLPWAPSNLCMPLVRNARLLCKTSLITAQLLLFV